jgi:hypothetical protein
VPEEAASSRSEMRDVEENREERLKGKNPVTKWAKCLKIEIHTPRGGLQNDTYIGDVHAEVIKWKDANKLRQSPDVGNNGKM